MDPRIIASVQLESDGRNQHQRQLARGRSRMLDPRQRHASWFEHPLAGVVRLLSSVRSSAQGIRGRRRDQAIADGPHGYLRSRVEA
jgi:hypothetical protein